MRLVKSRRDLDQALAHLDGPDGVGLVATMGFFHAGHVSLMKQAVADGKSVVSIFVNPRQFGPEEDFDRYPRDGARDLQIAEEAGIDLVYMPPEADVYPPDFATLVTVSELSDLYCGHYRPGHFQGVTTVVARLLGLIKPRRAYFGQKDYQQSAIIRRMVADLVLDVEVRVLPTVREESGLALSSRNVFLTEAQRQAAPALHQALVDTEREMLAGERDGARLLAALERRLKRIPGFKPQYWALADRRNLEPKGTAAIGDVLLVAGHFGETRLIDNCLLGESNQGARTLLELT